MLFMENVMNKEIILHYLKYIILKNIILDIKQLRKNVMEVNGTLNL